MLVYSLSVPSLNQLRKGELPKSYIHIFLTTTDNGSDQLACRSHLNLEFSSNPGLDSQIFLGLSCMKHQYHLIAKSHLQLCDVYARKLRRAWKYFSALATLCHVWRGHLSKIHAIWYQQHQHDADFLKQVATNKMPPLAVAGRWVVLMVPQLNPRVLNIKANGDNIDNIMTT